MKSEMYAAHWLKPHSLPDASTLMCTRYWLGAVGVASSAYLPVHGRIKTAAKLHEGRRKVDPSVELSHRLKPHSLPDAGR